MNNGKSILVLSFPRTGSTRLVSSIGWEIDKFFNMSEEKKRSSFLNLGEIIQTDCYKLRNEEWRNNFDNFFGKTSFSNDFKKNNLDFNKFLNFKNLLNNKMKINFIMKIFYDHIYFKKFLMKEIIECFDFIILNYRKNLLEQWISLNLATLTDTWQVFGSKRQEPKVVKIKWSKDNFVKFSKRINKEYKNYCKILYNKKHIKICYEKSLKNKNYEFFLKEKIQKINLNIEPMRMGFKMIRNPHMEISENFFNKNEFLKDYNSIKKHIFLSNVIY